MTRILFVGFIVFLITRVTLLAQEDFYNAETIREIRMRFEESNWRQILDSLFIHTGDEGRLKAEVTIDGMTYRNAGVRYKGYSSYNVDVIKNPFNIDLDYCIKNQNHLGYTKIKLSNVINDPSFVREVLAYEIARNYMPASRANFANLYINDTLIGLYTNVEAVDRFFTDEHFGSHDQPFFKGEPAKLQYPFGENANLAYSHGTDSSGYFPYYKMESETGWTDLLVLIRHLDLGADSADGYLNIDGVLWMHALNEVLLNLDSYIGYSQNYYLYQDDNGRFTPIIWDLNMSFGSFRESDGSYHFLGLTIDELKNLDPLECLSFTVSPRPLITKLLSDQTLQRMFYAHLRTILKEYISTGKYYKRGTEIQNLIDQEVAQDTNRFYPYSDFRANLDSTVGGTGLMIKYPGLWDLMEARTTYLETLPGVTGMPVITDIANLPETPVNGEPAWITARITAANRAFLGFRFATGGIFSKKEMADDGYHHDGIAGDSIYGAMIIPGGHTIQYYIYAENDSSAVFAPERAEYEFYTIQPEILAGDVVINEIKALPENGEGYPQDSWIELFNNTREPFDLAGAWLAEKSLITGNWIFPDTLIQPNGYLVIPAGVDGKGQFQAMNLPGSGGNLIFVNRQGLHLDSVLYGSQVTGKSLGRYPNGWGPMNFMTPTPSAHNFIGTAPESGFLLYPNPAGNETAVEIRTCSGPLRIVLYDAFGQAVRSETYTFPTEMTPVIIQNIDLSDLDSGLYFVRVSCNEYTMTSKLIID